MTTQEEWVFRARHLVDTAKSFEIKAAKLLEQANYLREQAAKISPMSHTVSNGERS